ncbi:hypothetical protein [Streptomyces sp. SPB074]|uniref:hypothetical protein n=1 Tax=Streptomyces sp. (strain SPB074) TaxID=465543 RepID=UPI00017F2713|nr:hypothetical protein [Streptomyces sp. SPB074]EDY42121.1 conserved hypothetical protein [Streptomyces sp. SPB074]
MQKEAVKGDTPHIRGGGPPAGEAVADEQKPAKRFDLSVPQVAGSALASVAAAIAASQLGVYGTVIGAGVMSVVATTGGSVFQHLFRRTGEQLRDAAGQVVPRHGVPHDGSGDPVPPTFLAHPERHLPDVPAPRAEAATVQPPADADHTRLLPRADADRTTPPAADADPTTVLPAAHADWTAVLPAAAPSDEATRVLPAGTGGPVPDDESRLFPAVPAEEATRLLGAVPGDEATRLLGPVREDEATRLLGTAREDTAPGTGTRTAPGAYAAHENGTPPATPGAYGAPVTHQSPRRPRGWRKALLTAVGVFAVSMAGITGYELLAGHSLSGGSGSTISKLGGNGGGHHQAPPPEQPGRSSSTGPADSTDPTGSKGQDGKDGSTSPTPGDSTSPSRPRDGKDGAADPSAPDDVTKRDDQGKPSPSTTLDPTGQTPGTGQESGGATDPGTGTGDQGDGGTGGQQPEDGAQGQTP